MEFEFMTAGTPLPPCMPLPPVLLRLPTSSTAKVMYARMLDEALAYGIEDENGILYIHFPIKELAAALSRSTMTIKRAMSELDDMGLVMRVRRDFSKPNRIYLLIPKADHTKSVKSRKNRIFDAGSASDEECIAGAFPIKKSLFSPSQEPEKTAEKGRLLRGGDPGPQGFELVVQHVAGASRAAGAADLRKKRENHRTSYHNFHIL